MVNLVIVINRSISEQQARFFLATCSRRLGNFTF